MRQAEPQQAVKLCSLCGRPIAAARLEALPGVTTCINCAKKHPRKVDTSGIELSKPAPSIATAPRPPIPRHKFFSRPTGPPQLIDEHNRNKPRAQRSGAPDRAAP